MKRSQLLQLIREELSKIPANQNINNNLMRIVNREKPELNIAKDNQIKYQGDPKKGENIIITKGNVKNGENILKQADQKNMERILRGEKPIYKESIFSSNYVAGLRPEGSWNELISVSIYSQEEGGYKARLEVSGATGFGMARRIQPKLITAVRPLEEFTPEYVIGEVEKVYNLRDEDKQALTDFVNSIPTEIGNGRR